MPEPKPKLRPGSTLSTVRLAESTKLKAPLWVAPASVLTTLFSFSVTPVLPAALRLVIVSVIAAVTVRLPLSVRLPMRRTPAVTLFRSVCSRPRWLASLLVPRSILRPATEAPRKPASSDPPTLRGRESGVSRTWDLLRVRVAAPRSWPMLAEVHYSRGLLGRLRQQRRSRSGRRDVAGSLARYRYSTTAVRNHALVVGSIGRSEGQVGSRRSAAGRARVAPVARRMGEDRRKARSCRPLPVYPYLRCIGPGACSRRKERALFVVGEKQGGCQAVAPAHRIAQVPVGGKETGAERFARRLEPAKDAVPGWSHVAQRA